MRAIELNNSLHFVMQAKGGAGKSVVAYLLAQYLINTVGREPVHLVDLDPNNKTLSQYSALEVEQIDILKDDNSNTIDQSKFDEFLSNFIEGKDGKTVYMVDTGSGEYLELNNYLVTNDIPTILAEDGKQLYIHVPVVYGDAETHTKTCLAFITKNYPTAKIIIWENEYFEPVNDKPISGLLSSKAFPNIIGLVNLPKLNKDTYERDFKNALKSGQTFLEVLKSKANPIVKNRMTRIEADAKLKLDAIFLPTVLAVEAPTKAKEDKK